MAVSKEYFVIGDPHGCFDELKELIETYASPDAQIVVVGDFIGKGPESGKVVTYCREKGVIGVKGNHDNAVITYASAYRAHASESTVKAAGQLGPEDMEYLRSLPLFLRLPEVSALIVHAGIPPGVPLEKADPNLLMNMRTIGADGKPTPQARAGPCWADSYEGPELVVYGHDATRGLRLSDHAVGLDTGCCYGGHLTAISLPSHHIHSIPARAAYAPKSPPKIPPHAPSVSARGKVVIPLLVGVVVGAAATAIVFSCRSWPRKPSH